MIFGPSLCTPGSGWRLRFVVSFLTGAWPSKSSRLQIVLLTEVVVSQQIAEARDELTARLWGPQPCGYFARYSLTLSSLNAVRSSASFTLSTTSTRWPFLVALPERGAFIE